MKIANFRQFFVCSEIGTALLIVSLVGFFIEILKIPTRKAEVEP